MDKKKAREFMKELEKLQEKYEIHIESGYEEEIDYDYEESSYVSGIRSYLALVDKNGFEISVDDLLNRNFTCCYCGGNIEGDSDFCNIGCEEKFKGKKSADGAI